MLDVGIVPRDRQRGPILGQRVDEGPPAMMGFREAFDRRKILRRALQHLCEFARSVLEQVEFEERTAQRDACGVIRGMNFETGARRVHGVLQLSHAAVLFGELSKRDRRGVLLDPSSKAF